MIDTEIKKLEILIKNYIKNVDKFPSTKEVSQTSINFWKEIFNKNTLKTDDIDETISELSEIEYALFKEIERKVYANHFENPITDIDKFILVANSILNRRKSRAGKSLEHHIEFILKDYNILFSSQCVTEDKKKPDFIFPSIQSYKDKSFPTEKLFFLGCKTSLKDRWRQIINEADRIPQKYLLTLDETVSEPQLKEMNNNGVILVMPKASKEMYKHKNIISFKEFIGYLF